MEILHFKIGLVGVFWDSRPIYSISINDEIILVNEVTTSTGENFYVEFDKHVPPGDAVLSIRLENKINRDTVLDPKTGEIVKDMTITINSIYINNDDFLS